MKQFDSLRTNEKKERDESKQMVAMDLTSNEFAVVCDCLLVNWSPSVVPREALVQLHVLLEKTTGSGLFHLFAIKPNFILRAHRSLLLATSLPLQQTHIRLRDCARERQKLDFQAIANWISRNSLAPSRKFHILCNVYDDEGRAMESELKFMSKTRRMAGRE
jgi:hypothetical protein